MSPVKNNKMENVMKMFLIVAMVATAIGCSTSRVLTAKQNPTLKDSLTGTWQMCNVKDSLVETNYNGQNGLVRYITITPETFMVVDIQKDHKALYGAFIGSYTVYKDVVTEFLQYAGNGYQKYLGEKNSFRIRIENGLMFKKAINNKYDDEIWTKVKDF